MRLGAFARQLSITLDQGLQNFFVTSRCALMKRQLPPVDALASTADGACDLDQQRIVSGVGDRLMKRGVSLAVFRNRGRVPQKLDTLFNCAEVRCGRCRYGQFGHVRVAGQAGIEQLCWARIYGTRRDRTLLFMTVGNERSTTDVTRDLTFDLEWQHSLTPYASWHAEAFGEDSLSGQLRTGGHAAVFDRLYDEAANGVLTRPASRCGSKRRIVRG